ncbi:MAG: ribosomal L7Ae/L30e/S12e/Gadd45 family protein [Bacillota bacterium]
MSEKEIFNYLGLAQKARVITSGVNTLIYKGNFHKYGIIIIAGNAPETVKRKFKKKAESNNVCFYSFSDKVQLGQSIGKSPITVLAIDQGKLAEKIKELIGGDRS